MNPDELTRMATDEAILSVSWGLNPIKIKKLDFSKHPMYKALKPIPVHDFCPSWAEVFISSNSNEDPAPQETTVKEPAETQSAPSIKLEEPVEPGIYSPGGEADSFWG